MANSVKPRRRPPSAKAAGLFGPYPLLLLFGNIVFLATCYCLLPVSKIPEKWIRPESDNAYLDRATANDREFYENFHYDLRQLLSKHSLPSAVVAVRLTDLIDEHEFYQKIMAGSEDYIEYRTNLAIQQLHKIEDDELSFLLFQKALQRVMEVQGSGRAMAMYRIAARTAEIGIKDEMKFERERLQVEAPFYIRVRQVLKLDSISYPQKTAANEYWTQYALEFTPIVKYDCYDKYVNNYNGSDLLAHHYFKDECMPQGKSRFDDGMIGAYNRKSTIPTVVGVAMIVQFCCIAFRYRKLKRD